MYKPEFKQQHDSLTELVSWLTTWQRYNEKEKRSNEDDQSINRKRHHTNESGHGEHNTQ